MTWANLPHLVGLEWFKLRKRPMLYVLLAVVIMFLVTTEALGYLFIRFLPTTEGSGMTPQVRQGLLDSMALPAALPGVFGNVQTIAAILTIVLAAVSFGGEFGWGTVRLLIGRGAGRAEYILGKTLALAGWAVVFVVVGAVAGLATAAVITALEGHGFSGALGDAGVGGLLATAARTYLGTLVYLLLAAFATVLTRSTAAGMAIGLVYYFVEGLVGNILGIFTSGWVAHLLQALIGVNVRGLMAANGQEATTLVPAGLPSPTQSALVLVLYGAAFVVAMLLLFRARDITAGGGQ